MGETNKRITMRIGIYTPYLDTLTGGERYMLTIAECLSRSYDVRVLWDEKEILGKAEKKLGLDLEKVKIDPNIFKTNSSLFKRLRRTRRYDILFYLSDGSIPVVMSEKLVLHFQHPVEWVDATFWSRVKARRAEAIICNSFFTKKYIDKKFRVSSHVLYPPAMTEGYKNVKKENIILTVGRYVAYPNGEDFKKLSFLTTAFKEFLKKKKNWKMVIITSYLPPEKNNFEKLMSEVKDLPIEIYPFADFKKIKEMYEKARIYWHGAGFGEDIIKNPDRAEHFGISTVEAMAALCVPIVFNGGGQKEIVKDGVNGFTWSTIEELLNNTYKVIEDNALYNKLSNQAKKDSEQFSPLAFCHNVFELLTLL